MNQTTHRRPFRAYHQDRCVQCGGPNDPLDHVEPGCDPDLLDVCDECLGAAPSESDF